MRHRHRGEPKRRPIVLSGDDPAGAAEAELTFVGTATVLIQAGGFTVLTDPNFLHAGETAYLGMGLTARRQTEPAMQPEDMPPLDFVLLSHHHGDHFDRRAAQRLDRLVPIVTEPQAARKVERQGFKRAVPLETWETQSFVRGRYSLTVQAVPAKHSPRALGLVVPPVMGSVLEYKRGEETTLKIYVSGDTLFHDRLQEIPEHHPSIDLCVLHLGGTRIAGVLLTMDDEQGVRALELIRPRVVVPVHFDDYKIFKSPVEAFIERAAQSGTRTHVRRLGRGETWHFGLPLSEAA